MMINDGDVFAVINILGMMMLDYKITMRTLHITVTGYDNWMVDILLVFSFFVIA